MRCSRSVSRPSPISQTPICPPLRKRGSCGVLANPETLNSHPPRLPPFAVNWQGQVSYAATLCNTCYAVKDQWAAESDSVNGCCYSANDWGEHEFAPEGHAENSPTFQRWERRFGVV